MVRQPANDELTPSAPAVEATHASARFSGVPRLTLHQAALCRCQDVIEGIIAWAQGTVTLQVGGDPHQQGMALAGIIQRGRRRHQAAQLAIGQRERQ